MPINESLSSKYKDNQSTCAYDPMRSIQFAYRQHDPLTNTSRPCVGHHSNVTLFEPLAGQHCIRIKNSSATWLAYFALEIWTAGRGNDGRNRFSPSAVLSRYLTVVHQ